MSQGYQGTLRTTNSYKRLLTSWLGHHPRSHGAGTPHVYDGSALADANRRFFEQVPGSACAAPVLRGCPVAFAVAAVGWGVRIAAVPRVCALRLPLALSCARLRPARTEVAEPSCKAGHSSSSRPTDRRSQTSGASRRPAAMIGKGSPVRVRQRASRKAGSRGFPRSRRGCRLGIGRRGQPRGQPSAAEPDGSARSSPLGGAGAACRALVTSPPPLAGEGAPGPFGACVGRATRRSRALSLRALAACAARLLGLAGDLGELGPADVTPHAIEIGNVRFVSSRVASDGRPFSRTGRAGRPAGPGE
jgi:hypothetical protein